MRRSGWQGLLGALGLQFATGCAALSGWDWSGNEAQFKEMHKLYTRLVRWEEFARASEHVLPDERRDFLDAMRALGPLHFTDYESEAPEYDAITQTATVHVRYTAYRNDTLASVDFKEEQRWTRDLDTGAWHVEHDGPPLVPARDVGAE